MGCDHPLKGGSKNGGGSNPPGGGAPAPPRLGGTAPPDGTIMAQKNPLRRGGQFQLSQLKKKNKLQTIRTRKIASICCLFSIRA